MKWLAILFALLTLCVAAQGQLWNGVLSSSRAVDWSQAGAPHMNDARTTACATLAAGASAATISAAMQACPAGQYVQLGAGTFNLTAALSSSNSNYSLRGMGPTSTFLTFTAHGSSLAFCSQDAPGGGNICIASTDTNYEKGPSNTATFAGTNGVSGTYSRNANSLIFTGISGTPPVVGQAVTLDLIDDQSDPGNLYVGCEIYDGSPACYNGAGTGGYARNGSSLSTIRGQQQMVTVTSVSNVGTTYTIGISPGLYAANWTSAKSPQAWWATHPVSNVGIENMSIDISGDNPTDSSGTVAPAIVFFNCNGCWAKGVRSIMTTMPNHTAQSHIEFYQCAHCEAWGNYIYGNVLYASSGQEYDEYGIAVQIASDLLVENNIVQYPSNFALSSSDCEGCVWGYNFGAGSAFFQTNLWNNQNTQPHAIILYGLYEGNIGNGIYADSFHGNHELVTAFRNRYDGIQQNGSTITTTNTIPVIINPGSRGWNFLANILGTPGYHNTYKSTPASFANKNTSIYSMGVYQQNNNPTDPLTSTTSMFFGNFDTVTNAVRWCGNSSNTGWATTCSSTSEVPTSGFPNGTYSNVVPATQTFPPSFIYATTPSWWASGKAWPAIGPDVSGGNVGQCLSGTYQYSEATSSAACVGGTFTVTPNVTSNPAMDCYFAMGGVPNGTGGPLAGFNSSNCPYLGVASGSPIVSLSVASLYFAGQIVNTTSSGQSVTLTNTGAGALNISSIAIAGVLPVSPAQFATTNTCGGSVAAGSNCTITVTFTPTYFTPKTANLVITSNAGSSPNSVPLAGIGTPAVTSSNPLGMLLYQGGAHPSQQISIFSGPINSSVNTYAHLISTANCSGLPCGILNRYAPGTYLTGVTHSLPLGCTASSCTGANATYLDHVATGFTGGSCPGLSFTGYPQAIDNIVDAVASLGFWNNFILANVSYGASANNPNTYTPIYEFTPDWADNLDTDCRTVNAALTHKTSTAYVPSWYIKVGSTYLQQTAFCTNTDTNDDSCKTAAAAPACLTTTTTIGTTCADGAATWTSTGTHAPPQDVWFDSSYPGTNGYQLTIDTTRTASITGGTATIPITAPATYSVGQTGYVLLTSGSTNFNCGSAASGVAVISAVGTVSPYTVSYTCTPTLATTAATTIAGSIFVPHAANANSPNAFASNVLNTGFPVPYELPNVIRTQYILQQTAQHYLNSVGYIGLGLSKGGESSQDGFAPHTGFAGWPFYHANQYTTYEKFMYAFEGQNGVGTDFAGRGNLNTNPAVEASYIYANNGGGNNNAFSTDEAGTLLCYANPTPPSWCTGTVTYSGGVPPAGKMLHGGDWPLIFKTYNVALSTGNFPVETIQTTNSSTPGSSPGDCPVNTYANGTFTVPAGAQPVTGAMSQDVNCTNTTLSGTGPFPSPGGYPGVLPLVQQYLGTNAEVYFCDDLLAIDPLYTSLPSGACPVYSQTTYGPLYKTAFSNFLTGASTAPVFTSANATAFTVGLTSACPSVNCFIVSATGAPLPAFTITSGTLPSGVTFVNNGNGTATLSGTPTAPSTTTVTFTATNTAGLATQVFTLTVTGGNCQGCNSTGAGQFILWSQP